MHSLVILWWFIKTSGLPYRQMSLFIASSTWPRSFIWWMSFYLHSRFIRTCCKNVHEENESGSFNSITWLLQTQSVMFLHIFQQTLFLLLIGQIYLKVIYFTRGIRPAINCWYFRQPCWFWQHNYKTLRSLAGKFKIRN